MSTPDLALVREFKRRAEQALPGRIVRVMLYGSRARGDARDDSDWDVAIFLRGRPTREDRNVLSDIGFDLMMEHGQHAQTVASTRRSRSTTRPSSRTCTRMASTRDA
jgi:predicted nucleotidyltransferase